MSGLSDNEVKEAVLHGPHQGHQHGRGLPMTKDQVGVCLCVAILYVRAL